jgi:cyanophycin synthetase
VIKAVGWSQPPLVHRKFAGGVSLFFPAAIDVLYSASAISEWAWALVDAEMNGAEEPDFAEKLLETGEAISEESNAALVALEDAAKLNKVAFLSDDELASLGHGRHSAVWPVRELPDTASLDWTSFGEVPVALVTGTNGKTSTVRLAAHILRGCRQNVGVSSTTWISINEEIVDRGDWSGPGGARVVLRHADVDVAILETARGGLLRRGLGVDHADVAIITNIAEDHLGDFASQSLDELLDIKWIVSRAVEKSGTLVLNADDKKLLARAADFPGRIDWFSVKGRGSLVEQHTANGGRAFVLDGEELQMLDADRKEVICQVNDVPVTLGGAARHNIANALAAAALSCRIGASLDDVRAGLTSMQPEDNPGRCNLYDVNGFKVLVDFAHNPHAMQALFDMAHALPAKRRILCFGQAGDRTDTQIRELARSAWSIGLDRVIISELEAYARGRGRGEVYAILREELIDCGARASQIQHFDDESESFDVALKWARPGDLVILLALSGKVSIPEKLATLK